MEMGWVAKAAMLMKTWQSKLAEVDQKVGVLPDINDERGQIGVLRFGDEGGARVDQLAVAPDRADEARRRSISATRTSLAPFPRKTVANLLRTTGMTQMKWTTKPSTTPCFWQHNPNNVKI